MRLKSLKGFAALAFAISTQGAVTIGNAQGAEPGARESIAIQQPGLDSLPLPKADVPDPLKTWLPWVLRENPALACPFSYNANEDRRCVWPGKISLALTSKGGGTFTYLVDVFAPALVGLPGGGSVWPQSVSIDGKPVAVTGAKPQVLLPVGVHILKGNFVWNSPPESLDLPASIGLVELQMNGKAVALPNIGENGQLWLTQDNEASERTASSQLTVRINRLISDDIPARITTQMELIASGKNQEVVLPNAVLNGFVPLELRSGLPTRVEADGRLRVQVRAGRWEIILVTRSQTPLTALPAPPAGARSDGAANTQANIVLPNEEVWAFQARNELRLVTLEGLTAIDPAQTTLPIEWRKFPSFVARAGDQLKFIESKRGDPQPAPDRLALSRNIWLDFAGTGYTVQDRITGTMNSSWRLEMAAPSLLGRAAVAGADQFITTLKDKQAPVTPAVTAPAVSAAPSKVGIEVRRGAASVVADSRIESGSRTISAVGWDKDFNSVAATLHLPPGWRFISAQGADAARTAWVAQWTLLDLFLLLIVALAFGRLFGIQWGIIALLGTTLAYHELEMSTVPWLIALIMIALNRVLPQQNKFARLVRFARFAAILFVVLSVLPFAITQVKQAMYPVLEKHFQSVFSETGYSRNLAMAKDDAESAQTAADVSSAAPPAPAPAPAPAGEPSSRMSEMKVDADKSATANMAQADSAVGMLSKSKSNLQSRQNAQFRLDNYDSKAMIQTGPGLPGWTWNSHPLSWNGPVEKAQPLTLWLISPPWNALLRIVSVILLGAMLLCLFEWIKRWPAGLTPKGGDPFNFPAGAPKTIDALRADNLTSDGRPNEAPLAPTVATRSASNHSDSAYASPALSSAMVSGLMGSTLLALALVSLAPKAQAQLPSAELLEQLRSRMTVPPGCLPQCASIARMSVNAKSESILLRLEVHANENVAVPLPGGSKEWQLQQVLLNGKTAGGLARDAQGTLWLQIPKGVQQVQMIGGAGNLDVIAFSLPLKPNRVDAELSGWTLDGVNENAQPDNSLTLSRIVDAKKKADAASDTKQAGITPMFMIERTLSLGLQWEVTTRVVRLTPANVPASLEVDLLEGESITTAEPRTEKGKALVSMAPQTTEVSWDSSLKEAAVVNLVASKQGNQFEVWQLSPGTQWHFALSGIPVTAHQEERRWSPKWQPWPGESVKISVSKPIGVQGQTLTVDGSLITVRPGLRATDSTFTTTLRSSQGGQHVLLLPEGASLQGVDINGQSQPIRLIGREIRLPLVPGSQNVRITWREANGIGARFTTPQVNLNVPSVNARIQLVMPADRWTLFIGGPTIGPAVLIWGTLVVMLIVAFGLSRVKLTPLGMLQWALLGIGLTQVQPIAGMIFVGWLLILGVRQSYWPRLPNWLFNLGQAALAGWTVIALAILVFSVSKGLLGSPEMQISGNGANSKLLGWFADRSGPELPTAWVISVPLWLYRGLMLLWALWLAYALLKWLKWAWTCFSTEGYWRSVSWRAKPADQAATAKDSKGEAISENPA
jgi:hypothetical protein